MDAWRIGFSTTDITPKDPIRMAGWDVRDGRSSGVRVPLAASAMALQHRDDEAPCLLVTVDLLGVGAATIEHVARTVGARWGIQRERFILNVSHTHAGPVVSGVLEAFYVASADERVAISRYTDWAVQQIVEVAGQALETMSPATLSFGQGLAGIAVNRRRAYVGGRARMPLADHDVPVLAVHAPDGALRGAVFGYACHATTIRDTVLSADYPGQARRYLNDVHPDASFLFMAGCGADANPLPRFRPGLDELYGQILSHAVLSVLENRTTLSTEGLKPLTQSVVAARAIVNLPLAPCPSREQFVSMLDHANPVDARSITAFIDTLDRGESLPDAVSYPLQVWAFGGALSLISMSGEVGVDYALRFKQTYGADSTWVAAYSDALIGYIPSARVLGEGGYEGTEAMIEYGFPAPFTDEVETRVADGIAALMAQVRAQPTPL